MTHSEYITAVAFANQCNIEYYQHHRSIISDASFDILVRDIEQYEHEHPDQTHPDSPTQHVGSDISTPSASTEFGATSFSKVQHASPMLSLGKVFTLEEVMKWRDGISKKIGHNPRLSCEYKYDGLSISLKYEEGELVQALTRGDGHEGVDVTANVLAMKGIPKHFSDFSVAIPAKFEVRGEILMSFTAFEHCNKARIAKGEEPYANPRNAASGILHCQDVSKRDLMKHLSLYAWMYMPQLDFTIDECCDHAVGLTTLRGMGFAVAGFWEVTGDGGINKLIDHITATRDSLKFPIDGIVFKVAGKAHWHALGSTDHHPNYAIAYKFPATAEDGNIKTTHLRSIEFSMANSGKVTPVAITDEVDLYGTKVKRFSLASHKQFMLNGPWHVGDTLTVTKGGEIIPKILKHSKDGKGELIMFPKTCPHCGSPIVIDGAYAFCKNDHCPHALYTSKSERDRNIKAATTDLFPSHVEASLGSFNPTSLLGKKIVVSGTFNGTYNRSQLEHLVTQCGGTLQSSVGKSTSFIVAGDNMGPSKRQKASQLGVKIISDQEFVQMIAG